MGSANILAEYLVGLGIKDDFSGKLKDVLSKSSEEVKQFTKGFVIAGGAVASVLVAVNTGIVTFATGLVKADDELTDYAKSIGKTKDEAFKMKASLDAIGKSMEEIKASAELSAVFEQLQKDSASIKPPDMSKGLQQVRDIQVEFTRLKQSGTYAIQWVGHYLLKYLQQPMAKMKETFSGLNDTVIKNLPKWSEKIGSVLASIVKLGMTVIRGAATIFNAIKRIFDMIPKELKMVGAALAALALFIRAGPIGKLIMIISLALLLLEDFYTYLDGGDALLGGVWQKLIDIWKLLKDSGAIEKFKEGFVKALQLIAQKLSEAKDYAVKLFGMFKESGSLQKFVELIKQLGKLFLEIVKPVGSVGKDIAGMFSDKGQSALEWFIQKGLPSLLDFLTNITKKATDVMATLNKFGVTEKVIKGLLVGFLGFKALQGTTGLLSGFADKLTSIAGIAGKAGSIFTKLKSSVNIVGAVKNVGSAFGGLGKSLGGITKIFGPIKTFLMANPFVIWIVAIAALIGIFALLFKNKDKVKEFVNGIKDKIKDFVGMVKDIVGKIVEMLPELIQTGIEIVKSLIDGAVQMLPQLIEMFMSLINSLIDAITENLPILIETGITILTSLIQGFVNALPKVIQAIITLISKLISAITKFLPMIIKAGIEILMALIKGIIKVLPQLIKAAIQLIQSIIRAITDNLPVIIKAGIDILMALIDGIINAIPQLIEAAIQLITAIMDAIIENLPAIIEAGIQILMALIDGIITVLPQLIQAAIDLILAIINAIAENLPMILEAGIKILIALVNGIVEAIPKLVAAIPKIVTAIMDGLKVLGGKLLELGANLVKSLWDGILSMGSWIGDKVGGFFKNLFSKQKIEAEVETVTSGTPPSKPSGNGPGHADGGFFDKEHTARFAEGNKLEAIVPLTKPGRAKEILGGAMNYLGLDSPEKISKKVESLTAFAGKASSMLSTLSAGLNQNTTNLHTTNNSVSNNNTYDMHSNFTIHDSSGRPEATANAVDRTVQMRLRNLQGVLS